MVKERFTGAEIMSGTLKAAAGSKIESSRSELDPAVTDSIVMVVADVWGISQRMAR